VRVLIDCLPFYSVVYGAAILAPPRPPVGTRVTPLYLGPLGGVIYLFGFVIYPLFNFITFSLYFLYFMLLGGRPRGRRPYYSQLFMAG